MSLDVIGAGFGRTGTLALKLALERLGFSKCYHMMEIQEHPEYTAAWNDAVDNGGDWESIFSGYRAAVDWPVCYFWRSLATHYPEAKVILTVRDPADWYESVKQTIHQSIRNLDSADEITRARRLMAQRIIMELTFDHRFEDREYAIGIFEKHVAEVQRVIPPDRLLTFEVAEGWGPLCEFLCVSSPDEPFPHTNTRREFRSIFIDGN